MDSIVMKQTLLPPKPICAGVFLTCRIFDLLRLIIKEINFYFGHRSVTKSEIFGRQSVH